MKLRSFLLAFVPLFTVVAVTVAVFSIIAIPTETTYACNPCQCAEDRRMNCQGIQYYAIYSYDRGGVCYLDAYRMKEDGSPGRRVWRVTSNDLAELPEVIEENTLIVDGDGIALYQLTTGELQVNAGPAGDGKVYVLIMSECGSSSQRTESSF